MDICIYAWEFKLKVWYFISWIYCLRLSLKVQLDISTMSVIEQSTWPKKGLKFCDYYFDINELL